MTEPRSVLEALLFSSDRPLSAAKLRDASGASEVRQVRRWVDELNREYEQQGRCFEILEISGGYQLLTRPEYHEAIASLSKEAQQSRLSSAALLTLAIIAYKQPITRAEIENVRGVQTGHILRALMEKGLIRIAGRQDTLGHPVLYGTTPAFVELLGVQSLRELPHPEEL